MIFFSAKKPCRFNNDYYGRIYARGECHKREMGWRKRAMSSCGRHFASPPRFAGRRRIELSLTQLLIKMSASVNFENSAQELRASLKAALENRERLPAGELAGYLAHPHVNIRHLTLKLLERSNDVAVIPALLDVSADPDYEISSAAHDLLRSYHDPAAAALLAEGLNHPADEARLVAVIALRKYRTPSVLPDLIRALGDREPAVRREAVLTLAAYRKPELVTALRSALRDDEALVRRAAVQSIPDYDSAFVFDDLILALDDEDWQVRQEAARGLRKFRSDAARAALLESLDDEAWQVVREAILSLAAQSVRVDYRIINRLRHPVAQVRLAAAFVVARVGGPEARIYLEPLLRDDDVEVRNAAQAAFLSLAA